MARLAHPHQHPPATLGDQRGPQVTVLWIDDTTTPMVVTPTQLEAHGWTAALPAGTQRKVVAALIVEGLAEHERLAVPDLRLLRVELLEHRLAHRPWWRRWGPWRWRW